MQKTNLIQTPQIFTDQTPPVSTFRITLGKSPVSSIMMKEIDFKSEIPSLALSPKDQITRKNRRSKTGWNLNKRKDSLKSPSQKSSVSEIRRISLRNTILEGNNRCSFLNFLLEKLVFPLALISVFVVSLILMQSYIEAFCFDPGLCVCRNLGIYFYSVFREMLQFDVIIIAWSYFVSAYLTQNFYEKNLAKILFLAFEFVLLTGFFFVFYSRRNEFFLADFRIYRGVIISLIGAVYVFILALYNRQLSKFFLRKLLKMGFFTTFYFIHGLYIKNTLSLSIFQLLLQKFSRYSAKNIFKLILLLYYFFYNFIAKSLVFDFYKEQLKNQSFPIEMIITGTKFITIDVISVQVMNVLTIPLDEVYSWISFANYIFSLVLNYLGWNLSFLTISGLRFLFKRKQKKLVESEEKENWNQLRRGCILEANIIIFTRIIIFYGYNKFFYITKFQNLFANCTLEVSDLGFNILWPNLILLLCSHTAIICIILFFMAKKKKMYMELIVEGFGVVIRAIFFIIYYTQVDVCIQLYVLLGILK